MGLQLAVLPGLCMLEFGVLAGVAISISAIRAALQKYRSQMILADLGPDAWFTVRHRQRPRKFGHAAPGAEYGDLPACRLCVGRYRAAGAGMCKNDDGT